jgi:hypothetical protein
MRNPTLTLCLHGSVRNASVEPLYSTDRRPWLRCIALDVEPSPKLSSESSKWPCSKWCPGSSCCYRWLPDARPGWPGPSPARSADARWRGKAICQVCRQFIVLCRELNLITQALVAIDGSKSKAINNRDKNFTSAKMKRRMEQIYGSDQTHYEARAPGRRNRTRMLSAGQPTN